MGELNEIWSYLLENYYVIVRLLVAAFLGGIVGIERGKLNRPAGVRTHMIVCVGSALVMLLGVEMREIYGDNAFLKRRGGGDDFKYRAGLVGVGNGFITPLLILRFTKLSCLFIA